MKRLMIPTIMWLLMPITAQAIPTQYHFEGTMMLGTQVTADWTVDPEATPLMTNWNNWTGNALYPVESTVMIDDMTGSFDHFCIGYCIFSSGNLAVLRMTNGDHVFQLTFTPDFSTWIENGSWLKDYGNRTDGGYSWAFFQGEPTYGIAATPDGDTGWLLAMALAFVMTMLYYYPMFTRRDK